MRLVGAGMLWSDFANRDWKTSTWWGYGVVAHGIADPYAIVRPF
jgi:hypothetical protein